MYTIEILYGNRINALTVPAIAHTTYDKQSQLQELMRRCAATTISTIILANQVHGVAIKTLYCPADLNDYQPRTWHADALITTVPSVALGIMTADCIPIIITAPSVPVVATIHAGWRGLCSNIIPSVITRLLNDFTITPQDFFVTVGACIGVCCYQVSPDFFYNIPEPIRAHIVKQRDNSWYCDLIAYGIHQIREYGIQRSQIRVDTACCTACSDTYHSYRRDKERASRNITLAWIRTLD